MNIQDEGGLIAKVDMLIESVGRLTEKQSILSEDVAALKVSVPRNAAVLDQKNKNIIVYIAEIAKWVGIALAILFGSTGADHLIK